MYLKQDYISFHKCIFNSLFITVSLVETTTNEFLFKMLHLENSQEPCLMEVAIFKRLILNRFNLLFWGISWQVTCAYCDSEGDPTCDSARADMRSNAYQYQGNR